MIIVPKRKLIVPKRLQRGFIDPYRFAVVTSTKNILLHMDGSNGSTVFTDSTGKHTWTASGTAQISTAQSKFGGVSGVFDGSTGGVSTPHTSDLDLGTLDWMVDTWLRPVSAADKDWMAHRNNATNNDFWLMRYTSGNAIRLFVKTSGTTIIDLTTSGTLALNTWTHVRIVRISQAIHIAIGGTFQSLSGSDSTSSFPVVNYPLWVGAGDNGTGGVYNGYIDELLLDIAGTYNATNFTPPSSPWTYP